MRQKDSQPILSGTRQPQGWWKIRPAEPLHHTRFGDVVCGDGLGVLNSLKEETADVIFLDPPFNLGKTYGSRGARADRLSDEDYTEYMSTVLRRAAAVLKVGGSLFLYHIPRWAIRLSGVLEENLEFNHWIAVSMKNGFVRGRRLYPAHYALLHYSRSTAKHLNRPKIPATTCPHCGDYTKDYGGYRQYIDHGVNLSDIWDDISPVRHRRYKNRSGNELPMVIPQRVTAIAGVRGGLFVDVFAGTGTTLVAARTAGMKYVGNDRELSNYDLIIQRLAEIRVSSKGSPNVSEVR